MRRTMMITMFLTILMSWTTSAFAGQQDFTWIDDIKTGACACSCTCERKSEATEVQNYRMNF